MAFQKYRKKEPSVQSKTEESPESPESKIIVLKFMIV